MKVLMIGDVVAKPGRLAVVERIQDLREQLAERGGLCAVRAHREIELGELWHR